MKKIEPTKKEEELSGEDSFFFGNLKDIQLITLFAGFSAVVITLVLMIIIPEQIDRTLIVYTLIGTSAFLLFYLSRPSLYLNPKFTYWPDTVFVIAITLIMYALRGYSDFYFILFLVLIAVDAFALRLRHFIFIVSLILFSVLFSNLFLAREFFGPSLIMVRTLIHVYSIIITAVVMRFFAFKALTEKKEKEKIRRLAQNTLSAIKNLRALLDNIGDGIFAVDENSKIYTSNTAAIKILGWDKAIINRKITEIMPLINQDSEKVNPVEEVIKTGKPYRSSDLIFERENEQMIFYVNVAPILGPKKKAQGAIVIFRDITKEKEIEEQRMEFVAVSSHELRTPLTIMEGYLFHVLNSDKLRYDQETKKYIEKAHKNAKALQDLITDLLDVSKLDRKQLGFSFEKVSITDLAKDTVSELARKAEVAGIKLTYSQKQKNIPKIMLDKDRIKEVFVNLIGNAIKFTEKGEIKIYIEKEKENVKISVSDTGVGISKEDQKFIFNKFYRAEGWRTKKTSGTGLGLYISRQIIEKHKGKIWVESRLGEGSVFYFSVPIETKGKKSEKKDIVKDEEQSKELSDFVKKL